MSRLEELQKLLALDGRDAFVLYGLGQELARLGRHDEAVGWYARCLEADPSYFYAYFHMARSQESMGKASEARATLRAGIAAARGAGDQKAWSEMQGYLDELEG